MRGDGYLRDVLAFVTPLLRDVPGVEAAGAVRIFPGKSGGPYAEVGTTVRSRVGLEIWFDSYLERGAPQRLSAWIVSSPRRRKDIERVANKWEPYRAGGTYIGTKQRVHTHYVGPEGRKLVGRGLLDAWGMGTYVGRYPRAIPKEPALAAGILVAELTDLASLAEQYASRAAGVRPDKTVLAEIRVRMGQARFRLDVGQVFRWRCAVSGVDTVHVLEAAHIVPHREGADYRPVNGLLLRADLHRLFDRKRLWIEPGRGDAARVRIAPELKGTEYEKYDRAAVRWPSGLLAERRMALAARNAAR